MVEIEHVIEVSEIVRHLLGNDDAIQRATYEPDNPDAVVVWNKAPIERPLDASYVLEFITDNYFRCLVTADEHKRLGKARAYHSKSQLGTVLRPGAGGSRYQLAKVRVAWMTPRPATNDDLFLPKPLA